ncbi:MAG: DMT family transporter [Chitinophagales bacterium]|nr:DMT family transporter [Chitinophagales bacterium]MDW8420195.1 DMT family transporter [Chitinophagales bacterium]
MNFLFRTIALRNVFLSSIPAPVRYMLVSTAAFAAMNALVKALPHLPAMELVMFRCGISLCLCLLWLQRERADWRGVNRKLLWARGLFGTTALFTFFITLKTMPLGSAVTIQYLSPVFTAIIGIFWLGERVRAVQWLFFVLSFSGVLLIKGFDVRIKTIPLLIGIASAVASGMAYNVVRTLRRSEHPVVVVLHFQIFGFLCGAAYCLFHWVTPSLSDVLLLLLIGIFTQIGQVNLTKALQGDKVANVSVYNYLGILYALFFGWLFFEEQYTLPALAGVGMVLVGVLLNYLYQTRQLKNHTPESHLTAFDD